MKLTICGDVYVDLYRNESRFFTVDETDLDDLTLADLETTVNERLQQAWEEFSSAADTDGLMMGIEVDLQIYVDGEYVDSVDLYNESLANLEAAMTWYRETVVVTIQEAGEVPEEEEEDEEV